jgi:hypothetical protein
MFRHRNKSHSVRRPTPRVATVRVEELLNNPTFKYTISRSR